MVNIGSIPIMITKFIIMKQFITSQKQVICVNTDAKKELERKTLSSKHHYYDELIIKDDEDIVFGSLSFFFDNCDKDRRHKFFKY